MIQKWKNSPIDKGTAFWTWFAGFFGVCGLHRLYLGKYGTGFLWLFTFGLLGVGQLADVFNLDAQVRIKNRKLAIRQLKATRNSRQKEKIVMRISPNWADSENREAGKSIKKVYVLNGGPSRTDFSEPKQNLPSLPASKSKQAQSPFENVNQITLAEQLEKFANLTERGYLTREEFDLEKSRLLGFDSDSAAS